MCPGPLSWAALTGQGKGLLHTPRWALATEEAANMSGLSAPSGCRAGSLPYLVSQEPQGRWVLTFKEADTWPRATPPSKCPSGSGSRLVLEVAALTVEARCHPLCLLRPQPCPAPAHPESSGRPQAKSWPPWPLPPRPLGEPCRSPTFDLGLKNSPPRLF